MPRGPRPLIAAVLSALFLSPVTLPAADEINLYSARKEALIKPLLDRFSEHTGIKVNLVTGKADALLKRLQSEGLNSPADLLITTDAGRLHRAKASPLRKTDPLMLIKADPLSAQSIVGSGSVMKGVAGWREG